MNPNVYGYQPGASNYVQRGSGGYEGPGTTNASLPINYQQQPPTQQTALHSSWGYQQPMPQTVNPIVGQHMTPPVSANVNQNQMQAPMQYANVPVGEKIWTERSEPAAVVPKPQVNFSTGSAMGASFGEDFNQTELFQGQPVLRQSNPPAQQTYQAKTAAPTAQQNGNKVTNKEASDPNWTAPPRYVNTPATNKPNPKVIEDEEEDEEEEEEDNDVEDDATKDPWFEPEEEEEDDFVPDMSGSDEDFTIGRKRKPRKGRGGRRVTRSQSLNTKKGASRSGRRKRRSQDDFIDDDDDSDDTYATVPIRRGQPALGRSDLSDDEYLPKGKRAKVAPKKPAPKRGRMRSKSTPLTSKGGLKYEVYSDSPDDDDDEDASDSDEEEIMLHRGQPVTNTRTSSKCSEVSKKTSSTLSEQSQVVFLVDRNMQERIKRLPVDCLYSDSNYIWRLQNSVLVKFKQRGDTNYFQATSNYLNYLPEMEKNYAPVSVEFLKDSGTDVVRLFDVPELPGSGTSQSGDNMDFQTTKQPAVKKRRGRPPKSAQFKGDQPTAKSKVPQTPPAQGTERKRGRPKKSKVEVESKLVLFSEDATPTAEETIAEPAQEFYLDDPGLLRVVVNDYMRCLSRTDANKNLDRENKTEAMIKFERKITALKAQLVESLPLSQDFKDLLEKSEPSAIEQCMDDHTCQALTDGSANKATKRFCFHNLGIEKKFFVCESVAERCRVWAKLHHFPQRRSEDAQDVMREIVDYVVSREGEGDEAAGLPCTEDQYLREITDLIREATELVKPTVVVGQ